MQSRSILLLLILSLSTIYAVTHEWFPLLDVVNLIFHEAGHTLMPFGEIIQLLGGSLFQILIPVVVLISAIRSMSWDIALASWWWAGESLLGVARYVADARAQELPLLGGDHDFAVLFAHWPWLFPYDQLIGGVIRSVGIVIMCSAIGIVGFRFFREKNDAPNVVGSV